MLVYNGIRERERERGSECGGVEFVTPVQLPTVPPLFCLSLNIIYTGGQGGNLLFGSQKDVCGGGGS